MSELVIDGPNSGDGISSSCRCVYGPGCCRPVSITPVLVWLFLHIKYGCVFLECQSYKMLDTPTVLGGNSKHKYFLKKYNYV